MKINRTFRERAMQCIAQYRVELSARDLADLRRITLRYDANVPPQEVRRVVAIMDKTMGKQTLGEMLAGVG